MDRLAFEARLKAEGWPGMRENRLEPRRHNHPAGGRCLVGRRARAQFGL